MNLILLCLVVLLAMKKCMAGNTEKISSHLFFSEYHGHPAAELQRLVDFFASKKFRIFFIGDSSLDNKYWVSHLPKEGALAGYEHVLSPPVVVSDISYLLNLLIANSKDAVFKSSVVINCAVEESTLAERGFKNGIAAKFPKLWPQDLIVKSSLKEKDILVVSIGGNDIALRPSLKTSFYMLLLMKLNSKKSLCSNPKSCWGFNHFVSLFRDDVRNYILSVIGETRPRAILVCMIYFPDEMITGSWADRILSLLGYDNSPEMLKSVINALYQHATSTIVISNTKIIPIPLFKALDGKDTADYVERVEPSIKGGEKIASLLWKAILQEMQT